MFTHNKTLANRPGFAMRNLICTALPAAQMHFTLTTTILADDTPPPVKSPMTAEQVKQIQSS